ncbi:MAG: AAA family ATPase [Actinomycetia bacterium]|nr:AAA family ATPase [Actinomycetes bacterium]
MSLQIAIYGKGGIGKSTIAANISAALAEAGRHVLQVGCDPKHDSTRLLLRGETPPTVLDYIRDTPADRYMAADIIRRGELDVDCAEAGGPEPGIGCAGRGILTTFDLLDKLAIRQRDYDVILYDVLGDVVCGGFAVPIRNEYADKVYIVTSGEFMSIYAANNILRGLLNYQTDQGRVGGLIFNSRGEDWEAARVERFAQAVQLPIVTSIPRDPLFAQSERAQRCLVAAFPRAELSELFRKLAQTVWSGPLYAARPLSDDQLEQCVLAGEAALVDGSPRADAKLAINPLPPTTSADGDPSEPISSAASESTGGFEPPAQPTAPPPPSAPLLSKALTSQEPLHGCAFSGALSITTQLTDCVTVAHGPQSCAHIAFQTITSISRRLLLERGLVLPIQTAPPIVSTDMNEAVMVFGGGELLGQQVSELTHRPDPPAAIFVVSTCPSGIIGENIQATTTLATDQTRVIPVAADGNLAGDYLQGIFLGYQRIAEELIDRQVQPDPQLVNIVAEKTVAESTIDNLAFVREVLERLGLRLNCRFIAETSAAEVRGLLRAPLNLLAYDDFMGTKLRDYLQSEYQARFFSQPFPVGFTASVRWVTELAAYCHQTEVGARIIADFQQRYEQAVAQLRPRLAGRRLMVVTFNHEIDWLLATALDLEMQLAYVGILDYSQDQGFQTDYAAQIQELHSNLDYTAAARAADIQRVAPDVLVCNYLPGASTAARVTDTIPFCPEVGFFSGLAMCSRWADMLNMNLGEGWRADAAVYRKYHA